MNFLQPIPRPQGKCTNLIGFQLYFIYKVGTSQPSIWEKEKGKGSGIVGGWKIGSDKKSLWAIMKETFFTPIGTHQSPRKTRSRRLSRRDCDQSESEGLNSSANVENFSRNLLTEIFNSIQKRKSISRKIFINGFNNEIFSLIHF